MPEPMTLRDTICHLIHRTDFILNRANGKALEPYGVTMYQAMSLVYVADHEQEHPVNQRALERYTQLSNPGVTKLVTALEKLELLERTHDPEDARSYILRTTEHGREMCDTFRSLIFETDARLTENLSSDEREQLTELLHKIYNNK